MRNILLVILLSLGCTEVVVNSEDSGTKEDLVESKDLGLILDRKIELDSFRKFNCDDLWNITPYQIYLDGKKELDNCISKEYRKDCSVVADLDISNMAGKVAILITQEYYMSNYAYKDFPRFLLSSEYVTNDYNTYTISGRQYPQTTSAYIIENHKESIRLQIGTYVNCKDLLHTLQDDWRIKITSIRVKSLIY